MRLLSDSQIQFGSIYTSIYDLVLCACGYEKRARFFASLLPSHICNNKVAIAFKDRNVLEWSRNKKVFRKLGYTIHSEIGASSDAVIAAFASVLSTRSDIIRILVDYSCMTRVWYAGIIDYLRRGKFSSRIEVVFAYTPSRFVNPSLEQVPNETICPLHGFSTLGLPSQPVSLVIGLGYECDRAIGLFHFVEAVDTYLFYASPGYDNKFLHTVLKNNKDIMSVISEDRKIAYPLKDLQATKALLGSLLRGLTPYRRVIIAPLGPKPFSLISLLSSLQFPNCDVWRVSPGVAEKAINRLPFGNLHSDPDESILLYSTIWG